MGDFNLPSLRWTADMFNNYILPTDRLFLDAFTEAGLTQVVQDPTIFPSNNVLDLCLVTDEERIVTCDVLQPFPGCCHGVVKIQYTFQDVDFNIENQATRQLSKKV